MWWQVYKCHDQVKQTAGFGNADLGEIIGNKIDRMRNASLDPISDIQGLILNQSLYAQQLHNFVKIIEDALKEMQLAILPETVQLPLDVQVAIANTFIEFVREVQRCEKEIEEFLQG
jgi:hypothetical protein